MARIANTITGPQAVCRHRLSGGEAVEDPTDQDPEQKRRSVDQRPHHQAEEEPPRPVLDQFPQDAERADPGRRS